MKRVYEVTISLGKLGNVLDGFLTIDDGNVDPTFLTNNEDEVATVEIQTDNSSTLEFSVNVNARTYTVSTTSTDDGRMYNGKASGLSPDDGSLCEDNVIITQKIG